ncbi:MAG: hypothetical protein NTV54_11610 [Ignavibacteriales bacterium]|nr:hypothetical protein [Ignavibacteriales bacterium]
MTERNRKRDRRFPAVAVSVFAAATILAVYPVMRWGSGDIMQSAFAGGLLCLVNALAGYAAIEYAFDRSYTFFLKVVLGAMGIRLCLMLAAVAVLLGVFHFHAGSLVMSLFCFYVVYLVLEVLFLQKKMDLKNQRYERGISSL